MSKGRLVGRGMILRARSRTGVSTWWAYQTELAEREGER